MRVRGVVGVKGISSGRVPGNAEARRVLDLRYHTRHLNIYNPIFCHPVSQCCDTPSL